MKHVRPMSQMPLEAQDFPGVETAIVVVLTVLFQGWDNFPSVIQNLQKFFAKV